MIFHAFWPLAQTRLFPNSRGVGVGGNELMQRHAWENEFGRKKGTLRDFMRFSNESSCFFTPTRFPCKIFSCCCTICEGICREGAIVVGCE